MSKCWNVKFVQILFVNLLFILHYIVRTFICMLWSPGSTSWPWAKVSKKMSKCRKKKKNVKSIVGFENTFFPSAWLYHLLNDLGNEWKNVFECHLSTEKHLIFKPRQYAQAILCGIMQVELWFHDIPILGCESMRLYLKLWQNIKFIMNYLQSIY